jgi:hypothetical protein
MEERMNLQRTSVNESLDNYIDDLAAAFENKPRGWEEEDELEGYEEEEEEIEDMVDGLWKLSF